MTFHLHAYLFHARHTTFPYLSFAARPTLTQTSVIALSFLFLSTSAVTILVVLGFTLGLNKYAFVALLIQWLVFGNP